MNGPEEIEAITWWAARNNRNEGNLAGPQVEAVNDGHGARAKDSGDCGRQGIKWLTMGSMWFLAVWGSGATILMCCMALVLVAQCRVNLYS